MSSQYFEAGAKAAEQKLSCTENPHKNSAIPYDKDEVERYKEWLDGWLHYKNPKFIGE